MSRFDPLFQKLLKQLSETDLLREIRPDLRHSSKRSGRRIIDLRSNDYLGLSHHPEIAVRGADWAQRYGTGSGSSRLVSGSIAAHEAVERKLANLKGTESALVFPSGYQANAGVLTALLGLSPEVTSSPSLVYMDRLNHASLHFACRAANVQQTRFRHNDMSHLEDLLKRDSAHTGLKYIVTESVFSMDGDRAPLATLRELADRYDAFLYVDDAHATGVLGPSGRGLACEIAPDLILGTCGKALGSMGAFIAGSDALCRFIVNRCSSFIYSTAIAPPVLGAIDAALDLLPELEKERVRIASMAERLRQRLQDAGHETGESSTQIVPFMGGSNARTLKMMSLLERQGILTTAIRPPTVPRNAARLRIALHAGMTGDDVEICADHLIAAFQSASVSA